MTEDTMIERIARTLSTLAGNLPEESCEAFKTPARAVVFAMRDPTRTMQVAGAEFFDEGANKQNAFAGVVVYQAMIDAALAES